MVCAEHPPDLTVRQADEATVLVLPQIRLLGDSDLLPGGKCDAELSLSGYSETAQEQDCQNAAAKRNRRS